MKQARLAAQTLVLRRVNRKIDAFLPLIGERPGTQASISGHRFPWRLFAERKGDGFIVRGIVERAEPMEGDRMVATADLEDLITRYLAAFPAGEDYIFAGKMDASLMGRFGPWRADIRPYIVLDEPGRFALRIRKSDNFYDGSDERHVVICDTLDDLKCAAAYLCKHLPEDWVGYRHKWFAKEQPFYDFSLTIEGMREYAQANPDGIRQINNTCELMS